MALKIFTGAGGERFVCDENRGFGDAVAGISVRANAPIVSCARERAAAPLLKELGKMSQPELYACSLHCTADCHGNCNPANRPGTSTHERRSDGVAYPGPAGRLLRYWQRGIDVRRDRVAAFIAEAAKSGWVVTQTYPGSLREAQHVNLRKRPRIGLWKVRPLRRGMGANPLDTGRLRRVTRLLAKIQEPGKRTGYLPGGNFPRFGPGVETAVKRFQTDHHVKADGVVGLHTYKLLRGTARRPPSRLDQMGIAFLVTQEGEVLYAYNDPAGHATFGVGHLLHHGPCTSADLARFGSKLRPRDPGAMRNLSRRFLDDDVIRFERAVMRHVPERWRGSHDRFNAFVSLAFNLGEEILTPQAPYVDVGVALARADLDRLAAAILEFDEAGSPARPLPGLTARRRAEVALVRRNR